MRQFRLGDNLISILKSHGFTENQRKSIFSHAKLKDLIFHTDSRYLIHQKVNELELRFFHPTQNLAFRITKNNKKVQVETYQPRFTIKPSHFEGSVTYSIQSAIEKKTNSRWVASRFLDAYKIDNKEFRRLPKGTRFQLQVEKLFEGPHFIRYGEVLSTDLRMNGRTYPKKFVRLQGGGFFISTHSQKKTQALYAPVNYIRISSTFRSHRRHPVTKKVQAHLGVDFELPTGDPVFSAQAGTVLRKGFQKAAGNFVVIRHSNGIETYYNHLHRIEAKIRVGKKVSAGERIGEIGCTGYCTLPHLHFAVKKNGRMVNPLPYLRPYHAPSERFLASRGYIKSNI